MANPHRTSAKFRERAINRYGRNLCCVAERTFNTRTEAESWIETQEGDQKRVTSFKYGRRSDPGRKYTARVYVRESDQPEDR